MVNAEIQIMEDDALALFSSRLKSNRLDESTLGLLSRMLSSSKDVKQMQHLRTHLLQFLRPQSLTIIRQSADKHIMHTLSTLDFFLAAFAILDDIQSCFSLRYEGLILRDSTSATHPHFQVTSDEWLKFAQDAFQNAFYSVAAKACENAISCFNTNGDNLPGKMRSIDRIHRLKDAALQLSSNHSDGQTPSQRAPTRAFEVLTEFGAGRPVTNENLCKYIKSKDLIKKGVGEQKVGKEGSLRQSGGPKI
ncbi:hypothetical protein KSS87_010144 [Heliosperma pusillum]|nr:hypothetical protein KSS87_010144 [Heliosperma pusillum]